jgi:hypothetical protein
MEKCQVKSDIYKKIFVSDQGALLDIRAFHMMPKDWDAVLSYLPKHYHISYSEDGRPMTIPSFSEIKERNETAVILMKIHLSGVTVNCHFFNVDQIDMDVLPEDVDSESKAQSVFNLMSELSRLLNKSVFLVPESSHDSPALLQESAICWSDPKTDEIKCSHCE